MAETQQSIDQIKIQTDTEPQVNNELHRIEKPPARFEFKKNKAKVKEVVQPVSTKSVPAVEIKPVSKSLTVQQIEEVLSNDLDDMYFGMTPDKQQEFKQRGEGVSIEIKDILEKTKINIKKISKLIFSWLKIIPGVNKYFLEQESKIKTDEILKLNL